MSGGEQRRVAEVLGDLALWRIWVDHMPAEFSRQLVRDAEQARKDLEGTNWGYLGETLNEARMVITLLSQNEAPSGAARTAPEGAGAPVSDWSWWVGSDESVGAEGIYDLYECGTRADAVDWAENHIDPGEIFHIIEARCRALRDDDEHMPFVARRNHEVLTIDAQGNAIAAAACGGEK